MSQSGWCGWLIFKILDISAAAAQGSLMCSKTLFEKQITVNGGHLITNLSSLNDSETPIVLIDDDLIDHSRIDQMITKIEESANSVR